MHKRVQRHVGYVLKCLRHPAWMEFYESISTQTPLHQLQGCIGKVSRGMIVSFRHRCIGHAAKCVKEMQFWVMLTGTALHNSGQEVSS